ncbi:MAG: VOC family protein [Alphaproteobacteria bacterium]|nr:VOC family protein [Alphaproteobacteria bacterium]
MEQRLSIITLGVRDIEKSKHFYNALGWKPHSEEGVIAYNLNSMAFALYPLEALQEDATVEMAATSHPPFSMAYNVNSKEDVSAVLEEAVRAGGKMVKPAQDVFWGGYSGYFSDPDGYLWEVAYNPFSPLGTKNDFQWGGA